MHETKLQTIVSATNYTCIITAGLLAMLYHIARIEPSAFSLYFLSSISILCFYIATISVIVNLIDLFATIYIAAHASVQLIIGYPYWMTLGKIIRS